MELTKEEREEIFEAIYKIPTRGTNGIYGLVAKIKTLAVLKTRLSTLEALEQRLPEEKPEEKPALALGVEFVTALRENIGHNQALQSVKQIIKEMKNG